MCYNLCHCYVSHERIPTHGVWAGEREGGEERAQGGEEERVAGDRHVKMQRGCNDTADGHAHRDSTINHVGSLPTTCNEHVQEPTKTPIILTFNREGDRNHCGACHSAHHDNPQ